MCNDMHPDDDAERIERYLREQAERERLRRFDEEPCIDEDPTKEVDDGQ